MSQGSPFRLLGLRKDADIAQIKRAYAKLLRSHRPDEDPAGFQRLHEAYEACLEQARWREQGWDDDYDDEAAEDAGATAAHRSGVPDETPFAPPDAGATVVDGVEETHGDDETFATDAFDAGAFGDELLGRMRVESPHAVETWLQAHDDLYSLDRKRALQPLVVDALDALDTATAARHYDTVARFFGMDTVSGTDGWLHHRLDGIQQRFGDAAEFERVLRTHARPQADWADRMLAKELLHPVNWLRRLFLIATPGLPGRIGALARALHAADPHSATKRLDAKASRFWERATDRHALHRERFAFVGTRLAIWNLCITSLSTAKGTGNWLIDWGAGMLSTSLLWLLYALVVCGFLRFRRYNDQRLQWDNLTLFAGVGTGIAALVTMIAPVGGVMVFAVIGLIWLGARGTQQQKNDGSKWATFAAAITSMALAMSMAEWIGASELAMRSKFAIASVYTMHLLVLHDVFWARHRGIPLAHAHVATGWLWWLSTVQAVLFGGLLSLRAF